MIQTEDSRRRLYANYVTTHLRRDRKQAVGVRYFPVLRGLPSDRRSRLLDIGCGSGDLTAEMRSAGYEDVVGIDVSQEQVTLAHRLGRLEVQQADVYAYLSDRPGRYDGITATDVLEHFERDEVVSLLDAVYGALAPGAVFVAQVPNATSPFFGNYTYGDFTHRSVFTARSIEQICRSAGFESIVALPVNPHVHGVLSGIRRVMWILVAGALKLALASETGQLRGHILTQNLFFVAIKPPNMTTS